MADWTIIPLREPPVPKEEIYGDLNSPNVLKKMHARKREAIARGDVKGYGHLQSEAGAMVDAAPDVHDYNSLQPWSKRKEELERFYDTPHGREQFKGYAQGGSVKHGSDTVVSCKNKFS